jgi:outer membrane protein assembly factor BamB
MKAFKTLAFLGMGVSFVAGTNAQDWPNWRGPNLDGISTETDWNPQSLNAVKIAWQAEIGIGFSSVSVVGGKAYAMGNINKNTDVLYCFDAVNGKELWRFEYAEPLNPKYYEGGVSSTPTVHEGKVYTLSKSGKVHCVDAETGKPVWNRTLPHKPPTWGFASSGLIVDDKVIFNIGSSGVALNKNDGQVVWDSNKSESGYATPMPFKTPEDKTLIAIFGKDKLIAIDPADGSQKWSYPWKTENDVNAASPIFAGDEVFITSGYNRGATLLKIGSTPKAVWENKNMRSQMSGPVRIGDYLYGINQDQLACVEWKTGNTMWSERKVGNGSLTAAGDKLIVVSERGRLMIVAATPEGFKELSGADILSARCWAPPVLSNGYIYFRNSQGKLACVDMRSK